MGMQTRAPLWGGCASPVLFLIHDMTSQSVERCILGMDSVFIYHYSPPSPAGLGPRTSLNLKLWNLNKSRLPRHILATPRPALWSITRSKDRQKKIHSDLYLWLSVEIKWGDPEWVQIGHLGGHRHLSKMVGGHVAQTQSQEVFFIVVQVREVAGLHLGNLWRGDLARDSVQWDGEGWK